MQMKSLMVMAVIALISVGAAFFLVTKGYIRIGKPDSTAAVADAEIEGNDSVEVELDESADDSDADDGEGGADVAGFDAPEGEELAVIPLEPVIVNLRGSFGRRYLKITVNLGVRDDGSGDEEDKGEKKKDDEGDGVPSLKGFVEGKLVEIRDLLISLLSAKGIEDVDGWADQDVIRSEIKEVLNRELNLDNGISKVFFTEFVVQ